MVAVSVTAQNTRVNDAEALTGWGGIGGGAGVGLETDYSYQGSSCVSRKGTTGERGIEYTAASTQNLSGGTYSTAMLKLICTTPGLLDTAATQAFAARIGSANSAYYQYDLQGSDTYPLTKSWLIVPVDPNVAAHRSSTTGSPSLTAVDYYALIYDQSGSSKAENQAMDAIDIGAGLTLVSGDGASADGVWQDFIDHDEGTVGNRYGYVQTLEGILFLFGKFVIGSATATEFTDSAQTIVFPDGLFAAGFSGVECDLSSASTVISMTTHTFLGRGDATGEDTRPVIETTGTSGTATYTSCTFDNFDTIDLTSGVTMTDCAVSNSGQISQVGATLNNLTISGSAVTTGAAIVVDSLTDIDVLTVLDSADDGIDLTALTATTITLTDVVATGSTGFDVVVDNASDVTLSLAGSSSVGTATNVGAGNVTISTGAVTTTITVLDADSGSAVQNARVYLIADTGGPLTVGTVIFNELTNVSGQVSESRSLASNQPVTGRVRKSTATPLYKSSPITATIDNGSGLALTAQLISDE